MRQEEKQILLKDLSARLPYGVKISIPELQAFMKEYHKITDFYYENHIDFRGLIENGLALDATNLNIY